MALGHADPVTDPGPYQTCDGVICLVMGDPEEGSWQYSGVRPLFTDWKADQPYTVEVTQADGSVIDAGSYNVNLEDYWTPYFASSEYHYGDFVASGDADGIDLGDLGGLSGASVYKFTMNDGAFTQLVIEDVDQHGHEMSYYVTSTPEFTNTLVSGGGGTADYIQYAGSDEPVFLWNSLFHSWFAEVPLHDVPADPVSGMDFDMDDYVDWIGILSNL